MSFKGYYMKIGDCTFQSPAIKRESYKANYRIVQVTDNKVTASGKLVIKPLPHKPSKFTVGFPVMKISEFAEYSKYWRGDKTGEDEMFLTCEFYVPEIDDYITGTFYHTDIVSTSTIYEGIEQVLVDDISFVEH